MSIDSPDPPDSPQPVFSALEPLSPLTTYRRALASGALTPTDIARHAFAEANGSKSRNTYLHLSQQDLFDQAARLEQQFPDRDRRPPLFAIPISLKDCFDLAGTVTTAGARFYAMRTQRATWDSAMAAQIRLAGALITGKTHLHPLAYGITGENAAFGDALQPRDATLLTGGSSSGAAASLQEGSALAAIGTDTGGSIRVPAALCGLTGFRASLGHDRRAEPRTGQHDDPNTEGLWRGGIHLAPSFDTIGLLLRDPRDLACFASELLGIGRSADHNPPRIGAVPGGFLWDASVEVIAAYSAWLHALNPHTDGIREFDPTFLADARDIFFPIQAAEAALIHQGFFDHFETPIAQRLHWGASITPDELAWHHTRLEAFRRKTSALFEEFDFLVAPCAPVSKLLASGDNSAARNAILRYTTPFSLSGSPVVALPGELLNAARGTGIQIAAPRGQDARLLAFVQTLFPANPWPDRGAP